MLAKLRMGVLTFVFLFAALALQASSNKKNSWKEVD